ncbi:hypothetical protein COBT_004246 [Conglomerata obtusa]
MSIAIVESITYHNVNDIDLDSLQNSYDYMPNHIFIVLKFESIFMYYPCFDEILYIWDEDYDKVKQNYKLTINQIIDNNEKANMYIHNVLFCYDHKDLLIEFITLMFNNKIILNSINYAKNIIKQE